MKWLNPIVLGGKSYLQHTWTGGDVPPKGYNDPEFRALRRYFFRDNIHDGGPLDLWACAGTSALERARIFWNAARLTAWRTLQSHREKHARRKSKT